MIRVALDTNVLAYAEGVNGEGPQRAALELLAQLPVDSTFLPAQVLGELFNVLVKKAHWSRAKARSAIVSWQDTFQIIETSQPILRAAIELVVENRLGIWDSIVLAGADESGCRLLLSEDLQDGFAWRGVTVANPFAKKKNELLASFLG